MKKTSQIKTFFLVFTILTILASLGFEKTELRSNVYEKESNHKRYVNDILSTSHILAFNHNEIKPPFKPVGSTHVDAYGIQIFYLTVIFIISKNRFLIDTRKKIRKLLTNRFYGSSYIKEYLFI